MSADLPAYLLVCLPACFSTVQLMVTKEVAESVGGLKKLVPTGTCVLIEGTLAQTPEGTKQVGRVCAKAAVSS